MKIRTPKVKPSIVDVENAAQGSQLPQPDPLPSYDTKFAAVVEHITTCDPAVEWPIIRDWLRQQPRSLHTAMEMLVEQADMAMRSKRLYLFAKQELERFELDWKDNTGILRDAAREHWELKKDAGMRKQITNDMIDDWIIENYGDTWKEMVLRLRDMKNTVAILEHLHKQVEDRAPDLRRLIEKFSDKGNEPDWFKAQGKVGKHGR